MPIMRHTRLIMTLLVCLCGSAPLFADQRDQQITEILTLTGVDASLEQLPAILSVTFDNLLDQKPDARQTIEQLKTIMTKGMAPQTLHQHAHDYLRGQFNDNELDAIMQRLSSPLARKMAALEAAASDPDSMKKIIAYAQDLEKNPPTETRINLIADLVNASNALESGLSLRAGFFRGFLEATARLDPADKRISQQQIDAQIDVLRERMQQPLAQEIILTFFYIYRSTSDEELREYIALYEKPEMVRFNHELNQAMAQAFRQAGQVIMEEMAAKLTAA